MHDNHLESGTNRQPLRVAIAGGSGYVGGELLRLLHSHPDVTVCQVSSERHQGRTVSKIHPHLRSLTELRFCSLSDLEDADLLFLCLPHGESMKQIRIWTDHFPRIIDLSGDFRLNDPERYEAHFNLPHPEPALLKQFVYGIPELHREEMRSAKYISSAGCNATATILPLYPLYREGILQEDRTVTEVKVGSSEGGAQHGAGTHHPVKAGSIRTYKPFGHRHIAEMEQELGFSDRFRIHFSATAIDMVRGIHAVSHAFVKERFDEREIWKIFRKYYGKEPFIRIIKEREGIYRLPEPKLLAGTNYCDIAFVKDPGSDRLIVFSALDNLMKGAAGQAVQAMNIMLGFEESTGLTFGGLHPV